MSGGRKALRLDGQGRDVTGSPGLWDDGDTIWHAPLVWSSEPPTEEGMYLVEWMSGRILLVFWADMAHVAEHEFARRWYGPLPSPPEPK